MVLQLSTGVARAIVYILIAVKYFWLLKVLELNKFSNIGKALAILKFVDSN